MKNFLLLICLVFSLNVFSQNISGTWNGKLNIGASDLNLVLHISEDDYGISAKMDSPDQGAKDINVDKITFIDNELFLSIERLKMTYKGVLKNDTFVGVFTQGNNLPLVLTRGNIAPLNRPQEPKPPFAYESEDMLIYNKTAGINLGATFTYPKNTKNFPVVVLISGSGPQDRNEEILGHKPFLILSDYLSNNGIGVIRFDDRGVGKSEGEFRVATSADFCTDVTAIVEYLKTRKDVNPKKIGLIGHSEGGMIAFMLAAKNTKDISYIVSLAGPGVSGTEILAEQMKTSSRMANFTDEQVENQMVIYRNAIDIGKKHDRDFLKSNIDSLINAILPDIEENKTFEAKKAASNLLESFSTPWFKFFMKYDIVSDIRKIKCPVLALNGGKDVQVDAKINLQSIEKNLVNTKSKQVKEYPNLNHLFQTSTTGAVTEYSKIEETMAPIVLKDISDWILKTSK